MTTEILTPITEAFARRTSAGQMAFIPFFTAGDPDAETFQRLLREAAAKGADIIEVGFPYSDPIADGPVIQSSYTRMLQARITVDAIFEMVAKVSDLKPPRVAMVSYAIILRYGSERFCQRAAAAGFSGLIVPDLPADEAMEFRQTAVATRLDLIQLLAPTSTPERTAHLLEVSSGFVYCIAVAGTTGVRTEIASNLFDQLRTVRRQTRLPLAVGFGISRPEHVDPLRGLADGVIVGSAVVRLIEQSLHSSAAPRELTTQVGNFLQSMAERCHRRANGT